MEEKNKVINKIKLILLKGWEEPSSEAQARAIGKALLVYVNEYREDNIALLLELRDVFSNFLEN